MDTMDGTIKARMELAHNNNVETFILESDLLKINSKKNTFLKKYNAYMIGYNITLKTVSRN